MAPDGAGATTAVSASRRTSFARDAVISIATQFATQGLIVATGLIMPRIIPPAVKGVVDPIMSLTLMLIVFDNLGLSTALIYHPMRRERSLSVVASTALTAGLIIGSLTAGGAALFLPARYAERYPAIVDTWHVGLVLATAPLQLVTSYLNATQLIAGRVVGYNVVQFLPSFLYVSSFFAIFFGVGPSRFETRPSLFLSAMVWARVIQWMGGSITAAAMLRKVAVFRPAIDWVFLKEAVRFGLRPYLRDVFLWLTIFFTGYYLGETGFDADAIGLYWLAMTAQTAVWQIPEALTLLFGNQLATLQTQDDRDRFTPMYCRNVLFACFMIALCVALASEVFVRFWAPKYLGSVTCIRVLLLGSVPYTLFRVLQSDFLGRGEINRVPFYSFLSFALLAVSTIVCVQGFGLRTIETVAICNAAAVSFVGFLCAFHYSRISGNPITSVLFVHSGDFGLWRDLARRGLARFRG